MTAEKEPLLTWQVHLWREEPRKGLAGIGGVLLVGALLWAVQGPAGALLLGGALLLSLTPLFLPQEYRLYPDRVQVQQGLRRQTLAWQEVRRVVRGEGRILLSPFPAPHPLEGWRGVVLQTRRENTTAIWQVVVERTRPPAGEPAAET